MNDREKVKKLQGLTEKEHLKYFRRILHFKFWCEEERLFFLWMYERLIIGKTNWDNQPSSYAENFDRFFEVINF